MSTSYFAKFKGAIVGGIVQNTSITKSQVDMNQTNITSVADPVHTLDAANKRYVDNQLTQSIRYTQITISGSNNFITIVSDLYGSFHVTVTGVTEGSPTAVFAVSKNHRSKNMELGGTDCHITLG